MGLARVGLARVAGGTHEKPVQRWSCELCNGLVTDKSARRAAVPENK